MNELSLFTGAGGGVLGTHGLLGWRCKGYVEWEEYAQKVIRARIQDGILDEAPIFGDIRAFISEGYARRYRGLADVVSGGFPCQPFSVAGKRLGNQDSRDMWPATLGVIREVRPRFAFLENVRGLLSFNDGEYFRRILGQLSEIGYNARWCVLSARDCGAPHKRERLWIVAVRHTDSELQSEEREVLEGRWVKQATESRRGCGSRGPEDVAHTTTDRAGEELAHARREHGQPWNTTRMEADTGIGASCDIHNQSSGERWWDTDPADLAHAHTERLQGGEHRGWSNQERRQEQDGRATKRGEISWWDTDPADVPTEPRLGRVVDGVAYRMDYPDSPKGSRLRAIGNGQVPIVAATAWQILTEAQG